MAFAAGAIVDGPAFDDDIERRISRSDLSAADDNSKKERTNPGAHSELSHRYLFRQRLPFKEALANFASLTQPRGWRLLSRPTKQNTNAGDLDFAVHQSGDP